VIVLIVVSFLWLCEVCSVKKLLFGLISLLVAAPAFAEDWCGDSGTPTFKTYTIEKTLPECLQFPTVQITSTPALFYSIYDGDGIKAGTVYVANGVGAVTQGDSVDPQDYIKTYTTPYDGGNAEKDYLSLLNSAIKTIRVCAYGFTDPAVDAALVAAKQRGVDVALVMDKTQAAGPHQAPLVAKLKAAGIEVAIGKSAVKSQLIHAKFTVVDGKRTESGSWNYSGETASDQDNTVDFIDSETRAQVLTDFWNKIYNHITHPSN
jgi:phosphatidylserine/phosphatidylglycerophosphate/cardiolipin synthase-like enzyme